MKKTKVVRINENKLVDIIYEVAENRLVEGTNRIQCTKCGSEKTVNEAISGWSVKDNKPYCNECS